MLLAVNTLKICNLTYLQLILDCFRAIRPEDEYLGDLSKLPKKKKKKGQSKYSVTLLTPEYVCSLRQSCFKSKKTKTKPKHVSLLEIMWFL